MAAASPQVLIAGAGPTGLVLALWLKRLGLPFRIVDQAPGPGTTSRALVVHARTLEFYRQVGLAEAAVAAGCRFTTLNLWVRGERRARAELGGMGRGLTPFPHMLILPQDVHEALLVDRLKEEGVEVERGVELVDFAQDGDGVRARLRRADGSEEECAAAYLAGCDGAHSRVRRVIDAGFPGGTYERLFYVADVVASGPIVNGELNLALDDADFLGLFPMKGEGRARLVGSLLVEAERRDHLAFEDVNPRIASRLGLSVREVRWFSTYKVHHRVAATFRKGRAFLLGDAAHIHSPVGGQGMNTGIGDAVNLAWKLAAVVGGRAGPELLDTYEPERIAFARRLVATTDRAFTLVSRSGPVATWVRLNLVPRIAALVFRTEGFRRFAYRTLSQTAIRYPRSALSAGRAGRVEGGDRLPWAETGEGGNFDALRSLAWQAHVYGEPATGLAEACRESGIELRAFAWRPQFAAAGLARGALYLVRPDGYVALADESGGAEALRGYLAERPWLGL